MDSYLFSQLYAEGKSKHTRSSYEILFIGVSASFRKPTPSETTLVWDLMQNVACWSFCKLLGSAKKPEYNNPWFQACIKATTKAPKHYAQDKSIYRL